MARLLPTLRVPELLAEERAYLKSAALEGARLLSGLFSGLGIGPEEADARGRFLFRRWVLECLLLLRVRGGLGFNDLANALGGLAGETLSPKLEALRGTGLAVREELSARPRRVRYRLTPAGERLADGVYTLTIGKAEHARSVREEGRGLPLVVGPDPVDAAGFERARAGFTDATRRFSALHAWRAVPADLEEGLATARRFSAACVHKWHGEVLFQLTARGPQRFRDLRAALGIGDQALSNALRFLDEEFGSIRRRAGTDAAYEVSPLGRFDLALGGPLLLLVPDRGSAPPLHAA